MTDERRLRALREATVCDETGEPLGPCGGVYLDEAGEPAWVVVRTGRLGARRHVAPLRGARLEGGRLLLDVTAGLVLDAPRVGPGERLAEAEQDVLLAHYRRFGVEPLAPGPAAAPGVEPDEGPLRRAQQATAEARAAAALADPLGDGSYAGDAAKAPLVDTDELED